MKRVLLAELTIFVKFQSIRIVFLVFVGLIVAVLALGAGKCHSVAHNFTPQFSRQIKMLI